MFKSIVGKTLFEKRWVILAWALGMLVVNFAVIQIYPPMRDAFSTMTESLPPELSGWFGDDGQIWTTLKGFISLEVVGQMGLMMVIFGILFALSMTPADEQNGTLLTQLSKPLSRSRLYLAKFATIVIATMIVTIGFWVGAWLGALPVEPMAIGDLLLPSVAVALLTLAIASLTYAISVICAQKTLGGIIVGVYATIGYFIGAMQGDVDILKFLSSLTPFNYYNSPNVLMSGYMEWEHVLVLLGIVVVPAVVAWAVFARRDLKTR